MIIIIGTGLAGYNLAREIRAIDQDIPVTMITEDNGEFYPKPQLSTALGNQKTAGDLIANSAAEMGEKFNLNILTQTRVTQIEPDSQIVSIINSEKVSDTLTYEKLILAVGANTPTPPMIAEPEILAQLTHINYWYQYQAFREQLQPKQHITIIGAGLVGCEFANDLTRASQEQNLGYQVTSIDPASRPLSLLAPKQIGEELQIALANQGVAWQLGRVIKQIELGQEKKFKVTLDDNDSFETDLIISAVGLKPKLDLAQQIGIETNKGIKVNEYLETTIKNIYALGDCAEINGWVLLYIAPIMQAAKALAKTLTDNTQKTAMQFPPMAVNIKTTCYPIVISCPPNADKTSRWEFTQDTETKAIRGYLKNSQDKTIGFILTKEATKERMGLLSQIDHWL